MNPPYDGNLHLQILKEAHCQISKKGEIISLSPIRWLQDPLAEMKKDFEFLGYYLSFPNF